LKFIPKAEALDSVSELLVSELSVSSFPSFWFGNKLNGLVCSYAFEDSDLFGKELNFSS
jgi:hypothetical protein